MSAALRLLPLGQTAGQRILARALGVLERCVAGTLALGDDEVGAFAAGLALASARRETVVNNDMSITRSDLLVINKTDLAPHVGASLEVMARDAHAQRGERPYLFRCLKTGEGVAEIVRFIEQRGMLDA